MTTLALTAVSGRSIAEALACVDRLTLARRGAVALVDVDPDATGEVVRALAFAGVDARRVPDDLAPPGGTLIAIGTDLAPVTGLALDLVRLRRMALGRTTREVGRGRLWGLLPPTTLQRDRCRALLRGEAVAFEWARRAWGSRDALRTKGSRRSLRPVVFDPEARREDAFDRRVVSTDAALSAWLFG